MKTKLFIVAVLGLLALLALSTATAHGPDSGMPSSITLNGVPEGTPWLNGEAAFSGLLPP
jgi:hypothetical protein